MSSEPLADVRDMYMAHTMFRREVGLVPALIRGVAGGDVERAATIADHFELVTMILEHHHRGEDTHLWPRLIDRAGTDAGSVVQLMEEQHEGVDKLLTEVRGMLPEWRAVADPAHGAQLAEITARLQARLVEHLQTEEVRALPLVEKHVTAAEWLAMVAEGAASIQPELGPLIFGLMAYEGDPATVQNVIATMPPELGPTVANDAAQAFAEHALRVHGTATPEHIGTRSAKETL